MPPEAFRLVFRHELFHCCRYEQVNSINRLQAYAEQDKCNIVLLNQNKGAKCDAKLQIIFFHAGIIDNAAGIQAKGWIPQGDVKGMESIL